MSALALMAALALSGTASSRNHTYDDGEGLGFGVTPWLHLGPSWVTTEALIQPAPVLHGLTFEANLQALVTFGGFGLGVSAGYFGSGGQLESGDGRMKLTGLQVLPLLMFSPFERFALHAKGGYIFGSVNDAESGVGAARVGGGVTVVVIRMAASDIALSADVTHTWVVSAETGMPPTLAITSGQIGLSFTFDPSALDS